MAKFLDEVGLGHLWDKIEALVAGSSSEFEVTSASFSADGKTYTELDGKGQKRVTVFNTDGTITERYYTNEVLTKTKVTSFSGNNITVTIT